MKVKKRMKENKHNHRNLYPKSFSAIRFKSVVLPAPRKPESKVTPGFFIVFVCLLIKDCREGEGVC